MFVDAFLLSSEFEVVSPAIVSVSTLDAPESALYEVIEPSIAEASPKVSDILSNTLAIVTFEV